MTLNEQFEAFDQAHGDVWQMFERFTLELIRAGRRHGSSDEVLHRIRWNYHTSSSGQSPKINNDHTAGYARKFIRLHPEHAGFFRTRKSSYDQRHYVPQELIEA